MLQTKKEVVTLKILPTSKWVIYVQFIDKE